MKYIIIDVEADGPIPVDYSMVSFAAIVLQGSLDQVILKDGVEYQPIFFAETRPISEKWIPEALKVSGYTREQTLLFPEPAVGMVNFRAWLDGIRRSEERLMFVSDNNGFDWQFINYYLWHYTDSNPFGHTSQNINDLYKGMEKNCFKTFKHLRDTPHSHDPRDDVRGNAEAMLKMQALGLKFK